MEALISLGYLGLFLAAFLAATVVPFSSEVVFSTLLFTIKLNPWGCVLVATLGNWLGGLTCYWIGRCGKMEWIEKYLRVPREKMERFEIKLHKYGDWFAFFSFLPGVGDAIAVASGFFRCNGYVVAASMLLGKFVRYVVWMWLNGLFM